MAQSSLQITVPPGESNGMEYDGWVVLKWTCGGYLPRSTQSYQAYNFTAILGGFPQPLVTMAALKSLIGGKHPLSTVLAGKALPNDLRGRHTAGHSIS